MTQTMPRISAPSAPPSSWPAPKHIPALDGIRAIAVLGVLVFHGSATWLPGGFLGVDVFFVLSGFLITSILLTEMRQYGRIKFGQFYLRRARRLLPALFLVLAFTAVLVLLFAHDAAERFRTDVLPALTYVTNWANIFGGQSYFEATGRPPMLLHLWSLAIEEQFYVIWPAVLFFAYRWRGRGGVRRVAIIGAIVSTLLMTVLSFVMNMPGEADPSRLYFGTDTHAMGILAGAALATVWRPSALPRRLALAPTAILTAIGAGALAAIIWSYANVAEGSTLLFRGGFLIFSVACAVLIAVASHPAVSASRILGMQPLRYLGERSYGLYLWHWPIFMVLRPGIDIGWTGLAAFILQMSLTLLLAELSYRYVEMPVRDGALGRIWQQWRSEGIPFAIGRVAIVAAASFTLIAGLTMGVRSITPVDASTYLGGATAVGDEVLTPQQPSTESGTADGSQSTNGTDSNVADPSQVVGPGADLNTLKVTAVGDSVMLGARVAVERDLPKATLDAAVSRQATEMYQRIRQRKAAGKLASVVVIHAGTNGPAYKQDLFPLLRDLSDRQRVVLVSTHMPNKWMADSNNSIQAAAAQFPNVRVADWAAASDGHREYFVFDGTHLTMAGGRAYAATIGDAITAP